MTPRKNKNTPVAAEEAAPALPIEPEVEPEVEKPDVEPEVEEPEVEEPEVEPEVEEPEVEPQVEEPEVEPEVEEPEGEPEVPPAPEEPGAMIVISQFSSQIREGFCRSLYEPGRIIPHPSPQEIRTGQLEDFVSWWGGGWGDPELVEGRRYPALVERPLDGALYLRIEPHLVRPLRDCSRSQQIDAIRRCKNRHELLKVAESATDSAALQMAKAVLNGEVQLSEPLALVHSSRDTPDGPRYDRDVVKVALADGREISTQNFYAKELAPLVEDCSDVRMLTALLKRDDREPVQELVTARIEQIEAGE